MRAAAEPQMRVGIAADVELVGAVERGVVAVRRALPDEHLVAGFDRVPGEGGVDRRGAALGRRRARPAHDFLNGRRQKSPVVAQRRELIGTFEQGEQARQKRHFGWSRHPRRTAARRSCRARLRVSCGGSSSSSRAWTTIDSMSSVGWARFSAMSLLPYSSMSPCAARARIGRRPERIALPDVERVLHLQPATHGDRSPGCRAGCRSSAAGSRRRRRARHRTWRRRRGRRAAAWCGGAARPRAARPSAGSARC